MVGTITQTARKVGPIIVTTLTIIESIVEFSKTIDRARKRWEKSKSKRS
jgi:hypothetical protein